MVLLTPPGSGTSRQASVHPTPTGRQTQPCAGSGATRRRTYTQPGRHLTSAGDLTFPVSQLIQIKVTLTRTTLFWLPEYLPVRTNSYLSSLIQTFNTNHGYALKRRLKPENAGFSILRVVYQNRANCSSRTRLVHTVFVERNEPENYT